MVRRQVHQGLDLEEGREREVDASIVEVRRERAEENKGQVVSEMAGKERAGLATSGVLLSSQPSRHPACVAWIDSRAGTRVGGK